LREKVKLKNAAFIQAFNKLKEEGFYDNFAKTLNLKPKTDCDMKTASKKPTIKSGEKTNGRASAESVRLSSAGK
jgi:hypothetical protein